MCVDRLPLIGGKPVFRKFDKLVIVQVFMSQPEFRRQGERGRFGASLSKTRHEQSVTLRAISQVSADRSEFSLRQCSSREKVHGRSRYVVGHSASVRLSL